jgi:transglutaminase-like putative cysteine protease
MVRLEIQHFTKYEYSEQVLLNPHNLFLIPQQRSYFTIEKSRLVIAPNPQGMNERLDMEGNSYYQSWFLEETNSLQIEADYIMQLETYNPYGFIMSGNVAFPFSFFNYTSEQYLYLQPYLQTDEDRELKEFTLSILNDSKDMISFLVNLVGLIHKEWRHTIRQDPGIWTASKVFEIKEGSCRDLSWMLMNLLRSIGLATRFVSGYAYNPELEEGHELHAWVELYLPGAGWLGLDPSLGLLTDHFYIPLSISFDPKNTLPVQGTYGGLAGSKLNAEVWIRTL